MPDRAEGFTLPELVAVLVITGILAAVAIPRFMSNKEFDVFGFTEQTASMLRFAQKAAIAKRRYVCVAYQTAPARVEVTYDPADGGTQPCTGGNYLMNPAGTQRDTGSTYVRRVPGGVTLTPSHNPVVFDTLGRPLNTAGQGIGPVTWTISSGNLSRDVVLEAESGYVR